MALVVTIGHRRGQRDLALDLVRIEIGGGRAIVDAAQAVDRAGGEEHAFDQRGLADPAVADDADVADLSDIERHVCLPVESDTTDRTTKKEEG
jgi:hypothetical protein